MNLFQTHDGVAPHSWLQHHLPWLGLLAMMLGLVREDDATVFDPDELNG